MGFFNTPGTTRKSKSSNFSVKELEFIYEMFLERYPEWNFSPGVQRGEPNSRWKLVKDITALLNSRYQITRKDQQVYNRIRDDLSLMRKRVSEEDISGIKPPPLQHPWLTKLEHLVRKKAFVVTMNGSVTAEWYTFQNGAPQRKSLPREPDVSAADSALDALKKTLEDHYSATGELLNHDTGGGESLDSSDAGTTAQLLGNIKTELLTGDYPTSVSVEDDTSENLDGNHASTDLSALFSSVPSSWPVVDVSADAEPSTANAIHSPNRPLAYKRPAQRSYFSEFRKRNKLERRGQLSQQSNGVSATDNVENNEEKQEFGPRYHNDASKLEHVFAQKRLYILEQERKYWENKASLMVIQRMEEEEQCKRNRERHELEMKILKKQLNEN